MTRTRSATLLAVVVALVVTVVGCQYPPGTRYVSVVFSQVDVTHDVVYRSTTTSTGAAIDLKLDVYQPHGDTATKRAAIMWMFGGGWVQGTKQDMAAYATDSARRGYVGVSIQYRIRPGGGPILDEAMDAYDDAVAAVEWLRANAATYGIDPAAIVVGGYSAGAINALNVIYLPGRRGPAQTPAAGGISVAGTSMADPTAGRPPTIMFHGTSDTTVTYASATNVCTRSNNVGNLCTLVSYQGAAHEIFYSQSDDILTQSSQFVFDKILAPLGYKPTTVS
jgi:acetyl esterase/lipase